METDEEAEARVAAVAESQVLKTIKQKDLNAQAKFFYEADGYSYGHFEEEAAKEKQRHDAENDLWLQAFHSRTVLNIEKPEDRATLRLQQEAKQKAKKNKRPGRPKKETRVGGDGGGDGNLDPPQNKEAAGVKKGRALAKVLALTGRGGKLHEDVFEGKPLRHFIDLSNRGNCFCSCRSKNTGEGYDDEPWVYCDNDNEPGGCFGYRCYHLNCIGASTRPKNPSKDDFVCEWCLRQMKYIQEKKKKKKKKTTTTTKTKGAPALAEEKGAEP